MARLKLIFLWQMATVWLPLGPGVARAGNGRPGHLQLVNFIHYEFLVLFKFVIF